MVEYGNQAFAATTSLKSVGRKKAASGCGHTDWEADHYMVVSCEKLRADKTNTQTSLA